MENDSSTHIILQEKTKVADQKTQRKFEEFDLWNM